MKFWHILLLLVLLLCVVQAVAAPSIPVEAERYRRDLVRNARYVWGLEAPIATFASQVHQESEWNAHAQSKYAAGLAQFTPTTADWISQRYRGELGSNQPFNPAWALRALVRYDLFLHDRARGETPCDRWWAVLRWYNGGEGHWRKEARFAANPLDHREVDTQCGKASRHVSHCPENVGYPRRILVRWQPLYALWGPGIFCSQEKS